MFCTSVRSRRCSTSRRKVAASSSVRVLSSIAISPRYCRLLFGPATGPIEASARLHRGAPADLVHRQILLVGRDEPAVAERVLDAADAVAVKLIRYRPAPLCPGRDGALDRSIDIVDVKMDRDRRAADRLRAERLDVGVLVGQHDAGAAYADLGVMDLAAGVVHAHHLGGAERPFVKGDRIAGGVQDEVGRHAVIALGNWFHHARPSFISYTGTNAASRRLIPHSDPPGDRRPGGGPAP